MRRTNLYLDEKQTAALDEIARAEGISRAALVRRLVDESIHSNRADLDADLAAIEQSFGALGDEDLLGRGRDERASHLERLRNG